jgi:membrane-bound ClpP family serine protease
MSKLTWRLFEYEYSLAEFVMSFVIVFIFGSLLLVSLTKLAMHDILTLSGAAALVLGVSWTYIEAHDLLGFNVKRKK